jgi:hypothetical protein
MHSKKCPQRQAIVPQSFPNCFTHDNVPNRAAYTCRPPLHRRPHRCFIRASTVATSYRPDRSNRHPVRHGLNRHHTHSVEPDGYAPNPPTRRWPGIAVAPGRTRGSLCASSRPATNGVGTHPKSAVLCEGGNGRPLGVEIMLRVYFVQKWFKLSDLALKRRCTSRRCCSGLSLWTLARLPRRMRDDDPPLRHLLEKHDLCGMMLDAVNIHREAKGDQDRDWHDRRCKARMRQIARHSLVLSPKLTRGRTPCLNPFALSWWEQVFSGTATKAENS